MSDINPKTFPKKTPHPLLKDLSDYLKDPANFDAVQLKLLHALASKHSHGEVLEWANCSDCQDNLKKHQDLMKDLGFISAAQYLAWKKVHETIKGRERLPKYNTPV